MFSDIFRWINANQGLAQTYSNLIYTTVTAIALIITVVYSRRAIRESRASNENASRQIDLAREQVEQSKEQYRFINQGYLQVAPNLAFINEAHLNETITPDVPITGINPYIDILNIGNIPLKYKVVKFLFQLNDQITEYPIADSFMILYPKEAKISSGNGTPFPGKKEHTAKELKFMTVKMFFTIEYFDISDPNIKTIKRSYDFTIEIPRIINYLRLEEDTY